MAIEALYDAADDDSATGGPDVHRRIWPMVGVVDASGVTFVDEAGRTATFTAGDIFLVEQGAECSWESQTFVKKVYAIYRPA